MHVDSRTDLLVLRANFCDTSRNLLPRMTVPGMNLRLITLCNGEET